MTSRRHSLRPLFAALLPLLVSTAVAVHAAPRQPRIISIAAARALPLGTRVTVAGLVSTPSDAFESSFFDKGFGIQDQTAGIFVSLQEDLKVNPRARVTVTGILKDSSGLLVIAPASPADVSVHGIGPAIVPEWVTTGAISEATEGQIVLVIGRISQAPTSDLPFGFKFAVDDGSGEAQIFINIQTGIDVSHLELGQLVSVTGFSSQFETHYEIDPRKPSDIGGPVF